MTTLLYTHDDCLKHDTGHTHPESQERLRELLAALSQSDFGALDRRVAPLVERMQLGRVHNMRYVMDILSSMPKSGIASVDHSGTVISPKSDVAALRAAGSVCAAVDAIAGGEATNAFCAIRPPGHHAEPGRSMGFCLFNNIAVGAYHAFEAHGYQRIAAIDFDVHHGNGTEIMFRDNPSMLFASIHQTFLFPHAHRANDTDTNNAINVGLIRRSGSDALRTAFKKRIFPRLEEFKPDFLFISAGFDAHRLDPVGDLQLEDEDFEWLTAQLVDIAARHAGGRLVSTLEGGYNPKVVARAGAVHVRTLMAA